MKSLAHVLLMTGAALALATVHHPTPAAALNATSSIDARLRLDWDVGTGHGGRPVIRGYVYNTYLRPAYEVRLLVETLDASGAVIASSVGFVQGLVPFNDRTYFEVPLTKPGASYRVGITAFDWRDCGGGM